MAEKTEIQTEIVDVPEVSEVFADSVTRTYVDGHNIRIELGVTRLDFGPSKDIVNRRYTACRLVIPPSAAVDLLRQLNYALEQSGIIKRAHDAPSKVQ